MSTFEYQGKAEIKHLNTRKEGPDDEKALALDVKLLATTSSIALLFFDELLPSFLYLQDTGAVRCRMIEPIKFGHEIENCELTIGDCRFHGVRLTKFVIDPVDGWKVNIQWQCSFQPTKAEYAILGELLQEEVDVYVAAQPDLFDEEQSHHQPHSFDDRDPCYDDAVAVVIASGKASISSVQRHLRIGYNRAARLIEEMELRGVVSLMDSSGNRKVLLAA